MIVNDFKVVFGLVSSATSMVYELSAKPGPTSGLMVVFRRIYTETVIVDERGGSPPSNALTSTYISQKSNKYGFTSKIIILLQRKVKFIGN